MTATTGKENCLQYFMQIKCTIIIYKNVFKK